VKNAQNIAQSIFLPKLMLNLYCGKEWSKNVGYFCNFQKTAQIKQLPNGQNSPSLVTLLVNN
jgi:hypothetical protein